MSAPIRRVGILWARLGPYHIARLHAAHAFLEDRGVELIALETSTTDDTYAWDVQSESEPFRRVTLFPGRGFESISGPEMEAGVRDALDRLDLDALAVPSYSTPDARAGLAWCRANRRVAVMLFDSRQEDADRSGWREAIKRAMVRQFDAALVAGTPQRAYAHALGVPSSHIFQPLDVVDNAHFARVAADARERRDLEDDRRFVVVSRLTPRKGVGVLVQAYNQYREAAPNPWSLVVVGDGPERAALEAQAGPGVTFTGFVQGDDVPAWYGRSDALVLPSLTDPWGLVANEAMAAGLPVVVSTGAGCATDLVEVGANGFTVSPDDVGALEDALHAMSDLEDGQRAGFGGRSREIVAEFDLDAFCGGLWSAIKAGRSRADRGLSLRGRVVLTTLRLAARSPRAFQAIPD